MSARYLYCCRIHKPCSCKPTEWNLVPTEVIKDYHVLSIPPNDLACHISLNSRLCYLGMTLIFHIFPNTGNRMHLVKWRRQSKPYSTVLHNLKYSALFKIFIRFLYIHVNAFLDQLVFKYLRPTLNIVQTVVLSSYWFTKSLGILFVVPQIAFSQFFTSLKSDCFMANPTEQ